jgi:hypothetical protein
MLVNENGRISLPGDAHFSGRSGAYGSKNGQSMAAKGEHFQREVFLRWLPIFVPQQSLLKSTDMRTILQSGTMLALVGLLFSSCGGDKAGTKIGGENGDSTAIGTDTALVVVDIPDYWAPAAGADNKYGYINTKGEWMVPPKFAKVTPFSEGLAFATETAFPEADYFMINTKGEKVLDPEGKVTNGGITRFGVSPIGYLQEDNKTILFRFMDKTGKFLPVGMMSSQFLYYPDGLYPVKHTNGKFGFQDNSGKWVIQPIYVSAPYQHESGLAPVQNEAGFGFIDRSGKSVTAFKYAGAYPFFEGKSIVKTKEGVYGYVDTTGTEHLAPAGVELYPFFSGGLIGAKQGPTWGFMDADFKMVIPPTYYELGRARDWGRFKDGLRAVAMGEKSNPMFRYIDTQGKVILDGKYMAAGDFNKDIAVVAARSGNIGLFGAINKKGQWIIKPVFTDIHKFTMINETGGR